MLLILIPLAAAAVLCGVDIGRLSARREAIKQDYSEVNSIRYGLLSVDSWKDRIQSILQTRIGDFKLSGAQEAVLRAEIGQALNAMITEADRLMRKHQASFSGKMRKLALRAFVNVEDVRKQVPAFTETIVKELETPRHTRKFKKIAQGGLVRYAAQTYDSAADTAHYRGVLDRYEAADTEEFDRIAEGRIRALEYDINGDCAMLLDITLAFLFAWWLARRKPELHKPLFTLSVAFAAVLLGVGLALPMIDLDARIKSVDFLLWGEHVRFHDQVLFFRSKSILQVVRVLMETRKGDSILVGALLLSFSVFFPLCKLAAMEGYMRGGEAVRRNPAVRFFAFKSGKWSMADVTVVAIFIAYIGFKGILSTQLAGLNIKAAYVEVIATNDTALQPGFILFTAFVLFGFALSAILKRAAAPAAAVTAAYQE
ncbi:MAG: paraquat-inducible protein A [Elusimicrobiota bacterium]